MANYMCRRINDTVKMFSHFESDTFSLSELIEICKTISLLHEIRRYYIPILVCLGLLGNCLSICVFFRTKLRHFSSSIFLSALAISDISMLVITFIIWLQTEKIFDLSEYPSYKTIQFLMQHFWTFLSVWFVTIFTVERYLAIQFPLRRQSWCTVARAKIVVIGLTGVAILDSIPWGFVKYPPSQDQFLFVKILLRVNTAMTFVLPLAMIVIFNILIVYNLCKQDHDRRKLIVELSDSNERTHIFGGTLQAKITKMLVLVSSIFVCLYAPRNILSLIAHGEKDVYRFLMFHVAWTINDMLYFTNFGINFVLYCISGQNFRAELIRMFTKRSETGKIEVMQMGKMANNR